MAQRFLPNVQALPLLAHRLQDEVDVWVVLVGVQDKCVAVPPPEFLPRQVANLGDAITSQIHPSRRLVPWQGAGI